MKPAGLRTDATVTQRSISHCRLTRLVQIDSIGRDRCTFEPSAMDRLRHACALTFEYDSIVCARSFRAASPICGCVFLLSAHLEDRVHSIGSAVFRLAGHTSALGNDTGGNVTMVAGEILFRGRKLPPVSSRGAESGTFSPYVLAQLRKP
jgi:hypothetical protein